MKIVNTRDTMTPREREEFEQEKTIAQLQADYQVKYKTMELEIKRIETRWTQVFRLPFALLMLPIRLVMAIAIIPSVLAKRDLPAEFWRILGL